MTLSQRREMPKTKSTPNKRTAPGTKLTITQAQHSRVRTNVQPQRFAEYKRDPLTFASRVRYDINGQLIRTPATPSNRKALKNANSAWSKQYPVRVDQEVPSLKALAARALSGFNRYVLNSDGSIR